MVKLQTLVVYDISDTNIRARIAEACRDFGLERIQKSAFRGFLTATDRKELFERLKTLVARSSGRVLMVPVCQDDWAKAFAVEHKSDEYPAQKAERAALYIL
ncbi:MAG: CRISPR-associated endonuclease Cas2 [bacterium JZ-2024 1]